MIELRALGTAEIHTGTTILTPSREIVFAAALFMIVEGEKKVSRARLASLLWPCTSETVGAHRLRQTIFQLKKLGFAVNADRNTLQELPQDVRSDLDELKNTASDLVANLGRLEFLPGYSPTFSPVFRDWVESRREEYHILITRRLVAEINTARARTDWQTCDKVAAQCLALDPLNECAVLARAEASAMRGAKSRALELLDRYASDLGSEDPNLRVSPAILRRRISERIPESSVPTRDCGFTGRDREMQQLTAKLVAARNGDGSGCLIKGEAGIGKSRLASELMRFGALEGILGIRTACRRSDVDRPLSVFVDLVPHLTAMRGALGCSQQSLGTLRRLTEFDGRASSASALEETSNSDAKVRAAVIDLIDAVADEQPLLITIEDLQWVDSTSLGVLRQLLSWARKKKIFFVLTQRINAGASDDCLSTDNLTTVGLAPLKPVHSESLLGEIFRRHSGVVSPEVVERLLVLGEGNPFFLQELGNHWLERGSQAGFPPSITTLVNDRVDRLSNEAIQVLQTCAVLGVNASIEWVEAVLEYKSHSLLSAVQELSMAGMLRGNEDATDITSDKLIIRHDLLSTAAIARLAKASLAFLHRRAGMVLERETLGGNARISVLWACAFHWRNAGDRERAFRAALACADHLLEVGLPHDAVPAFESVLSYCITDEQRLLVFSRLAAALQMNGQWEQSKEILRNARQLQKQTAPDASAHDVVEFALFEARWRVSLENGALLDDLRRCTHSGDASVGHRVACGLLGLKVATELNRLDLIEDLFVIMRPLLEDPQVGLVVRLEVEMIYHSMCGKASEATVAADHLLEVVRNEGNHVVRSRALGNVGIVFRLAGRKEEAEAIFIEVFEHAKSHGLVSRMSFAALSLCRLYLAAGQVARAKEAMERVEHFAEGDQDLHRAADRLYFRARLAFEDGDLERAWERYLTLGPAASYQSVNRRAAVLAVGIRVAIQRGTPTHTVHPMVTELEAAHVENRASGWQDFETLALGLGLRYCGRIARARVMLGEYLSTYRKERGAPPESLINLLNELRAHYAVSTTRRIEPLSGVL